MNARQLHININEKVDEIIGDKQENLKMLNYLEECAPSLHRVIIENEDIFNEIEYYRDIQLLLKPSSSNFNDISQIDLTSAFKLFKVKDSQTILANTVCPLGCFGSSRLQFGWTSSSYIFHTTLNRHMKLWNIDKFIQYIDDIIFYDKVDEFKKLERPTTKVQMRRVLGKLNFVPPHNPKFLMIVKNLYPKNENYD
uniref:Reverse transcriptase domain-containing protein n=1 Tax=Strongyloides venezuelensis TaxID=75913 RepID=A0A0K0FN82_STRVS